MLKPQDVRDDRGDHRAHVSAGSAGTLAPARPGRPLAVERLEREHVARAPERRWRAGTVLPSVLALAAFLRLWRLAGQSLWLDEILSINRAREILEGGLGAHLLNAHGPLFFYVLAAILPPDTTETVVRLPSVVFGLGLILVAWFSGREFLGARGGAVAATVMALSPYAIWYSQEARYINLFMLLAAVSTLLAHRALRRESARAIVLYGASALLMLFSFVGGVFLLVAQNLWAALARPSGRTLRRWVLAQALVAAVFVPWFIKAYELEWNPFGRRPDPQAETTSLSDFKAGYSRAIHPVQIGYVFFVYSMGYSVGPSVEDLHEDPSLQSFTRDNVYPAVLAILLVAVVGLAGVAGVFRRSKEAAALLVLCLLVPILGAYGLASVTQLAYNVRYTSAAFPAFILLLSAGLMWWWDRARVLGAAVTLGLAALAVYSLVNYYDNAAYAKEDSRGVARLVETLRKPGEPLVVGALVRPFDFYYEGSFYRWDELKVAPATDVASAPTRLFGPRLWLAATRKWQRAEFRDFLARMERCYPAEARFRRAGYELTAYRLDAPRAPSDCTLLSLRDHGPEPTYVRPVDPASGR